MGWHSPKHIEDWHYTRPMEWILIGWERYRGESLVEAWRIAPNPSTIRFPRKRRLHNFTGFRHLKYDPSDRDVILEEKFITKEECDDYFDYKVPFLKMIKGDGRGRTPPRAKLKSEQKSKFKTMGKGKGSKVGKAKGRGNGKAKGEGKSVMPEPHECMSPKGKGKAKGEGKKIMPEPREGMSPNLKGAIDVAIQALSFLVTYRLSPSASQL